MRIFLLCCFFSLPLHAASFDLASGDVVRGDVVWVTELALELMPEGTTAIRSIPLGALAPAAHYDALRIRRHLTGEPGHLELARKARGFGYYEGALRELSEAERNPELAGAAAVERQALRDVMAADSLTRAQSDLAAGRYASAGRLLDSVARSGSSSSATAQQLLGQHAQAIASARQAAKERKADREARREAKKVERAKEHADEVLAEAAAWIAEADALRIAVVDEHLPISRARRALLAAARLYVEAANACADAAEGIPEEDDEHKQLEATYRTANAKLADCYCDLADLYLVRSNLQEAYDWANIALVVDPDSERAQKIRDVARLGGALSGNDGVYGLGVARSWGTGLGGVRPNVRQPTYIPPGPLEKTDTPRDRIDLGRLRPGTVTPGVQNRGNRNQGSTGNGGLRGTSPGSGRRYVPPTPR